MAPAGIVSLNSSGSRSRSSTVISMAIASSGSKTVIDTNVWFEGSSQRLGVNRELVKIRCFVLQATKSAPYPESLEQRVVEAQAIGELGQQLRLQSARRRRPVHVGDCPRNGRKDDDPAAQAQ